MFRAYAFNLAARDEKHSSVVSAPQFRFLTRLFKRKV